MSDPIVFDPLLSWQPVEERLRDESDPVCRGLLEQVRDHMRAEILGELDPLMDTLVAEPRYHFRSTGPDGAPKDRAAVRAFYEAMIAGGGNRFHFDIERIFVDHGGVVTEGKMRQPVTAEALRGMGIDQVDEQPVEAGGRYLSETHILTVWPAGEDGRLVGEDIFFGSPPVFRRAA